MTPPRRRLGAQLSVRLGAGHAEKLRRIASNQGAGYTSLVRQWVEERIDRETTPATTGSIQLAPGAADSRINETIQIAGYGRLCAPASN